MVAVINHTALEYGDFFIQSTPYWYTVAETHYTRHGNFEPFYHVNRNNGDKLRFTSIRSAMLYCDIQRW